MQVLRPSSVGGPKGPSDPVRGHARGTSCGWLLRHTGRFTRTAKDYAKSVNIALYDRARLPFLVNEAHPVSTDFSTASVVCRECGSVVSVPVKVVPASAQCENGHTITSNIVTADFRILAEGEVPYCDSCGAPMRLVNWNGREFWGCTGYPKCRATKPLRGYRHSTTRV